MDIVFVFVNGKNLMAEHAVSVYSITDTKNSKNKKYFYEKWEILNTN